MSFAVFSQIRKLARNTQRWGDPTKYDLDIVVDKNGGATGYYSVQPISKEPLSAVDQQIKDNIDLDDLKRRVTPPTPELVQKRLDKINGVGEGNDAQAKKSAHAGAAGAATLIKVKAPAVNMTDDDDDLSESFPSYDA